MSDIIGLIAAMHQESQAFLRLVKNPKRSNIGNLPAWAFSRSGQSCVLVTSGMGVRRAALAAQSLVEKHTPKNLISFGIAGAVEADLDIGDVVLAEAYCRLENNSPGEVKPLATWSVPARDSARQALGGLNKHLYLGAAVTTNGAQLSSEQLPGLAHPVLEMETAGIAGVAALHNIPLYSLRAISDGPKAPIPLDLGAIMDEDANYKVGEMLKTVLRNPRILGQSVTMMRNTQLAATNAALALAAALGELLE